MRCGFGSAPFFSLVVGLIGQACGGPPPPSSSAEAAREDGQSVREGRRLDVAAAPRNAGETVVFRLHKFMQPIGIERDTYVEVAGGTEAKAVFAFRDRGSTVSLAASYALDAAGAVRRYEGWGSTSRFSSFDDVVEARGDGSFRVSRLGRADVEVRPAAPPFAASGYAPMLSQDLLARSWVARGRPATIPLLPEGTAALEGRGKETFEDASGNKVVLEHVGVTGLVWGRQDLWLDESGKLAAAVTRDAEFDHFQATRDELAALLPQLVDKAGADGVAWLAETARGARSQPDGVVALVGGLLIDGTGRAPVKDSVVVVDGDRIAAAGPRASTRVPDGATVVDVSGKTVLPGLWDMHAHFQQVEQGVAYLAAGVTTVRDVGNMLEFITGVRDAIDRGQGLGPRIVLSCLVDGDAESAVGTLRIKKREEIAEVIGRLARAGCREVKLYQSIAPGLVKRIAAEAHRRGLRVTGHIPTGMNALEAVAAGFDGVNHVHLLLPAMVPELGPGKLSFEERLRRIAELDLASPAVTRVLDTMARKRIVMDPTLAILELLQHTAEENAAREPGIATLPATLREMVPATSPRYAKSADAAFRKLVAIVGELHRRGAPIVAGTDIAVLGHSLHRELELYVQAGLTPMQALEAATVVPARVLGLDKELGTVEPGKRADLIVVAGDPLADIRATRKVVHVVTRGAVYDAAALWRLVGFEPAAR